MTITQALQRISKPMSLYFGSFVLFAIALAGDDLVLTSRRWPHAADIMIALLPLLPFCGVVIGLASVYHRGDELERRILTESTMVAFVATAFLSVAYALLETPGFVPHLPAMATYTTLLGSFGVVSVVVRLRYR